MSKMSPLTPRIKEYLNKSVLCWLSTVSSDGQPNVSPKELFTYISDNQVVIANIASPKTIRNIKSNPKVCMSFVEIFVQKGYQLYGQAELINEKDITFEEKAMKLKQMAGEAFPIHSLLAIKIESVAEIIAPSYRFYPDTKEEDQIKSAMNNYGVQPKS